MIACENLRFSYDGQTRALDGVSLTVDDGEFLCILGGNGSGKSTLAKHLNALLVPDEGRVVVDGLDTSDPEYVYDIRSRVGYVFQNPDDQIVATLVEDDVAFGPENLGVESSGLGERVRTALEGVGLTRFERRETHALSGGQKQRVAIAGVLAMCPHVLVFDEATSMLDPRGRNGLLRVCRELHDQGMTIIMITHFMEEAAAADRIVVLDEGKIALEGTPGDVLTRVDDLVRLNLEVPPACHMAMALRRRGFQIEAGVDEHEVVDAIEKAFEDAASLPVTGRFAAAAGDSAAQTRDEAGAGADAAAEPCLTFEHVSYSYERSVRERARRRRGQKRERSAAWGANADAVWALHNVDLTVRRGEFLGLAGHTGSGKSTLIQHMNGLVHPTMGRVRAFGRDLAGKRGADELKCRVGMVFQYPEHQLFAPTVFEDVAFGPRNLGCAADEVDERVRRALDQVGLVFDRVAEKSPFMLSGGQQRRVAFAGVLAMEPEILVLDEPAAGLDPAARREFLDLVAGLHRSGLTVVMASHSMDDLAALCDRIVVMNEGEVLLQGTASEVFACGDELHRVGLGLPAAQRMATRLAAAGVPVPLDRLYDLDALADELAALAGIRKGDVR